MPTSWSLIRRVTPPPDLLLADLYYRVLVRTDGAIRGASPGRSLSVGADYPSGRFDLPRGLEVSFLTAFGCLPEIDLLRFTRARRAALSLVGNGDVEVSIARNTRGVDGRYGSRVLVRRSLSLSPEPALIDFDLSLEGTLDQPGVIHFEVRALSDVVGIKCAWHIDATPRRHVGLAAVVCTVAFDRNVAPLLARLPNAEAWPAALRRMLVVNNRAASQTQPVAERFGQHLAVITQNNVGGCGGFTRGLVESMSDPDVTHVLFMDDDIYLDFNVLANTALLCGFVEDTTCVGGQMLDLRRPLTLAASGEFFDPGRFTPVNPRSNLDLGDPAWWQAFATDYPGNWNGWWYFALPVEAVRSVGLPLPMFLKGDDIEYGLRLARAGCRLATVPGIAVWHEPFDVKIFHWDLFFVTRNTLILTVLHFPGDQARRLTLLRTLWANAFSNLLKYRYAQSLLIDQAIRDFLLGPASLAVNAADQLRALNATIRDTPDHRLETRGLYPRSRPEAAGGPGARMLRRALRAGLGRTAGDTASSILFNLRAVRGRTAPRAFDTRFANALSFAGADVVRIDDPDQPAVLVCRRDRRHFVRGVVRMIRTSVAFLIGFRSAAAAWRAAAPDLASAATWTTYFALNGISTDAMIAAGPPMDPDVGMRRDAGPDTSPPGTDTPRLGVGNGDALNTQDGGRTDRKPPEV